MNAKVESLTLRPKEFFNENGIEIMLNRKAKSLNTKEKIVTLDNGSHIKYIKIFLASGSR